jgi:hypothetical protein|tara:strand:- start:389 stop:613 length:225 start_codon:yes stop_codon:yes gene_type:complete
MTLQEFYDLLKAHDWSYEYSDDHRYWNKGRNEDGMIQHILQGHSRDPQFRGLYDQYRSWAFDTQGDITKPERPE